MERAAALRRDAVSDEAVGIARAGSGLRALSRYYQPAACRGAFQALGVRAVAELGDYARVLRYAAAVGPPCNDSLTCVLRICCNLAFGDMWRRAGDDAPSDGDEEGDEMEGGGDGPSLRSGLAEALGDAPVFPAALPGAWAPLKSLLCHVPSAAEAAGWSEPTRARLLVTALPAGLIIKGAAELMPRFAAKVLQLPPFAGCRRAAVHTTAPSVARAGRSCARVCVAALVLQRWSLGDAQPPEREALRAALQRLQVEPAERLRTCTELIDSNSGELVERTAGLVSTVAPTSPVPSRHSHAAERERLPTRPRRR